MPFRIGSGTRLKLIEALASGIATVSTDVGAEGYALVDGEHLRLEDDPGSFATAVLELLDDKEQREQMSRAGREFAEHYDWRRVIPRFNRLYTRLGLM
jgi:glycosyltransferase involved in cell wall biosynthesis